MRWLPALALALLAAGCTTDPRFTSSNEAGPGRRITLNVAVDTKGVPLGSYQIVIAFDPADARIVSIRQPADAEFRGAPRFSPAAFTRGQVRVTGYSLRQSKPSRPYQVIAVLFEQIGAVRSHVGIDVERLYDTSNPPLEMTRFDVLPSRDALDFSRPDP